MQVTNSTPPHGSEAVLIAGNTVGPGKALILLHGRGASAEDILSIKNHLDLPEDVIVMAPQASGNTWYPERFIMPIQDNQPNLDSALERISTLVNYLEGEFKLSTDQIALAGFSQGACLTAEYLKRNPMKYLAGAIFSGGLIGTDAEVNQEITGSLASTPIYLGCDEEDFHIPKARVIATAEYLSAHKAEVTLSIYSKLGHTIHPEGLKFLMEKIRLN